jgi:cytochrome c553
MQAFIPTVMMTAAAAIVAAAAAGTTTSAAPRERDRASQVARGAYLVSIAGCHDCHTPWVVGPKGPHDVKIAEPPSLGEGPWVWAGAGTNTAFAGPWGISFTANLTPDPETGLGKWTEEMFIATIRTGRHQGVGRPVLPPMPVQVYANMSDDDLKAVFAYLQSLTPVRNRVPAPIDPPEESR